MDTSTILTLIIALFGGLPGIIQLINFIFNKINFKFILEGINTGTRKPDNQTMVLITGTVINNSETPLIPNSFDLKVKSKIFGPVYKWTSLQRTIIPDNPIFESNEQTISYTDINNKDLQKSDKRIDRSNPLRGHMMFFTKDFTPDFFRGNPVDLKIICNDVNGKKYKIKLKCVIKEVGSNIHYPKHGIMVGPKR
ncbi:MAG TPA: hypothetical protein VJH71_01410 [Candidatus Paceibacterota bacterium]